MCFAIYIERFKFLDGNLKTNLLKAKLKQKQAKTQRSLQINKKLQDQIVSKRFNDEKLRDTRMFSWIYVTTSQNWVSSQVFLDSFDMCGQYGICIS